MKNTSEFNFNEQPFPSYTLNWKTDAEDLMSDIVNFLKEYYVATFTPCNDELKIVFKNGQSFMLSIKPTE